MEPIPTRSGALDVVSTDGGLRLVAGASLPEDPGRDLQQRTVVGFPEYRLAAYFAERPLIFAHADHIVVAEDATDGQLAGLVVARWRDCSFGHYLHVEMNLVTVEWQRRGLLIPLWRVMLVRLFADPNGFPDLVAIKTYNPMVYSCLQVVAKVTGATLYPAIRVDKTHAVAAELGAVARSVAESLAPQLPFDPSTGVIQGAGVPLDFYSALPTTNKRDVQAYFADQLAPGDRILCLVHFGAGVRTERLLRRLGVHRSQVVTHV